MKGLNEFLDVVLGTFTDVARMLRSLLASRTTWVMALGFFAVYVSSGKVEAFQQLLAYLGLGGIWVAKMGIQNIIGQVNNNKTTSPEKPAEVTPVPTLAPSVAPPGTPTYDTWDLGPPIPFDKEAFAKEVESSVNGMYGESNPATLFFTAEAKLRNVWKFNNSQSLKEAWQFIFKLVGDAFIWKWGTDYDNAILYLNDSQGCPSCATTKGCTYPDIDFKARQLGMDYYFILREYRRVKDIVDSC